MLTGCADKKGVDGYLSCIDSKVFRIKFNLGKTYTVHPVPELKCHNVWKKAEIIK